MNYYISRKKQIPTDSKWYKTVYKYQNWFFADSTEIIAALNTGTTLRPKEQKNNLWFEAQSLDISLNIFDILIKKGEWEYASSCIESIISSLSTISSNLYVEEAKLIFEKVGNSLKQVAIIASNPLDDETLRGQLILIDSFGRLAISLLAGLNIYLNDMTCDEVTRDIRRINFHRKSGIYRTKLPGSMLTNLEATLKGINIEYSMEGNRVSPEWYIVTITTRSYLQKLSDYYEFIKQMNKEVFEENIDLLIKSKKILQATHLTENWVEFSHNLLTGSRHLQKLTTECKANKKVLDLNWPELDFDSEVSSLIANDKKANSKLVSMLPDLAALPRTNLSEFPDYFGQAYTFGVMTAYDSAHDNDSESLKREFAAIFIAALRAYGRLGEDTQNWSNEQSKHIFNSEPFEDLLELSGYIKIYAELYSNNDLWLACENTWNVYLSDSIASTKIQMFTTYTAYRDAVFSIKPRDTIRQNWNAKLYHKLESLGLATESFPSPFSDNSVSHDSPLIRVLARRTALMDFAARDVFYITYLKNHEAASGINFSDRHELERSIQRESNNV